MMTTRRPRWRCDIPPPGEGTAAQRPPGEPDADRAPTTRSPARARRRPCPARRHPPTQSTLQTPFPRPTRPRRAAPPQPARVEPGRPSAPSWRALNLRQPTPFLPQDEFWGVEVKPGKKVTVKLLDADDSVLHLTQARAARARGWLAG